MTAQAENNDRPSRIERQACHGSRHLGEWGVASTPNRPLAVFHDRASVHNLQGTPLVQPALELDRVYFGYLA
jgi:hypothetical protein